MQIETLTSTRELHSRISEGLQIRLLWCEENGRVWVSVTDTKRGEWFSIEVRDRSRALDVFNHPFGYAAHYGIETSRAIDELTPAISPSA